MCRPAAGRRQLEMMPPLRCAVALLRPQDGSLNPPFCDDPIQYLGHPDMIVWSAWDCIHLGGPAAHALHGGFRERSERSWGATLGAATGGTAPVANVNDGYTAGSTHAARTQPRGRVRAPPKVPEICPQKTEFDLQNAAVCAFLTACGQTQLVNACSERRPTGPGAAAGLRPAVSAPAVAFQKWKKKRPEFR